MSNNLDKKVICSPYLNEDITMFSNKNGEDINISIKNDIINEDVISLKEVDNNENNLYIHDNKLLLNDFDNYFYKSVDTGSIDRINFNEGFKSEEIFFIDDNIINKDIEYTNLSNMKTNIDNEGISYENEISFSYDKNLENKSSLYEDYTTEGCIILSIKTNNSSFDINNYIYQLRINGIPTKYFELSLSEDCLYITFYNNYFTNDTGINEFNQFDFIIKNPNNNDMAFYTYSRLSDTIRPFISYDPMVETSDDITINCRYDISTITTNQTKDIVINVNNPNLLNDYNGIKRPIIDNNLVFIMNSTTLGIRSLGKARFTIENKSDIDSDNFYLISKNDISFEKEYYKVYNSENIYKNTNTILLKPKDSLSVVVESIKDVKTRKKDTMSIKFMKLSQSGINKIDKNDFNIKSEDILCYIVVKINVVINPVSKYVYSQDEEEIMKNIFTFNTDVISTTFGTSEAFTISANDNIILHEPEEGEEDLNSDSLKEKINNGELNLSNLNKEFNSFDIICYGIYIDHMIIDNDNIGEISFHRLEDIKSDDLTISNDSNEIVKVCNVYEENITGDKCNDGFNELAFEYPDGENNNYRIIIVPDTVFQLFNFTNSVLAKSKDGEKEDKTNYILYPTAQFTFDSTIYTNKDQFKTSNLYIDYKPVKYRIKKQTTKNENGAITSFIWTLYTVGEEIDTLKNEKIIKLVAKNENEMEDEENNYLSDVDGVNGDIYDTNSKITYPAFVNFKINMETENGKTTKIDELVYEGKITNFSQLPILIQDTSLNNFIANSYLFKLNNGKIDEETTFMNYEITIDRNAIQTDKIKISRFNDKTDTVTINESEGNLYIIKPNGSINIKIYNSKEISNIPKDFGKTLNKLNDSLHYEVYYLVENEDKTYSFRENYSTNSTKLETQIEVIPSISNLNFDISYMRYGDTVYNIINDEIEARSVAFRLITNDNDLKIFSNQNNYETYIDKCYEKYEKENQDPEDGIYKDITTLDLEDIYFLESGKNFSYKNILEELIYKYIKNKENENENAFDYEEFLNNIIGIQVITRTLFTNNNKSYDMVIIDNYNDLTLNISNFKPKLNRLTGSLYHLLKIENKYDDLFEYKILVDNKEYNEYDIITNDYSNEIALHKFRLYFKYKNKEEYLINNDLELGKEITLNNGSSSYIGKFDRYIDSEGNECKYDLNDVNNNISEFFKDHNEYITMMYQDGYISDDGDPYLIKIIGHTDIQCMNEYLLRMKELNENSEISSSIPSNDALLLLGFNVDTFNETYTTMDKKISIIEERINDIKTFMKSKAQLIGDVDKNGKIDALDASLVMKYYSETSTGEKHSFEINDFLGDVDKNGTIDSLDASYILDYYTDISINKLFNYKEKNSNVGIYAYDTSYYEKDPSLIELSNDWILADSFEGCIDGTKPVVPNLLISENEEDKTTYKNLHKYSTLTRDEIKDIIKNPDKFLNEINYYEGNVSILKDTSYDMKFSETKSSNLVTIKAPKMYENILSFTASDKAKGAFEIENITDETVNIQINEISGNKEYKELYTITTSLLDSQVIKVDNYNPLYKLEPKSTMYVYVQFNKPVPDTFNSIIFNIRVENNYNKTYSYKSEGIKWDKYQIKLIGLKDYGVNKEIIKNILPYSFYDDKKNISEYYDMFTPEIFDVIDVNNFNKNSLYTALLYLDNTLIYNSNVIYKPNNKYKLLVDEKILDRLLYIGNHTMTLITNKFNGLLNYQNYFLTIIDNNIYYKVKNENDELVPKDENYFRYFKDNKNGFFNTYIEPIYTRNSLILRNPKNEGYNSNEFKNELFMNNNGDISIVTKDTSEENNYYLYKFTEIMKQYMNLSEFLVDSNQYLFEKNYQEILLYYNKTKENYNVLSNKVISKINKDYGEIYKIIDNINYKFEIYDNLLEEIEILKEKNDESTKTENKIHEYIEKNEFVSRLFAEDFILSKYKEFNFIFDDSNISSDSTLEIKITNKLKNIENTNKTTNSNNIYNDNYIYYNGDNTTIEAQLLCIEPFNTFDYDKKITSFNYSDIISIENTNSEIKSLKVNLYSIYNHYNKNKKYNNFKVYFKIKIDSSTKSKYYLYKINMYNLKDSLIINNTDDIKLSRNKRRITKTLTNITDIPIPITIKDNMARIIFNSSNGIYTNNFYEIIFNSKNGYFFNDETFIIPAHSNCEIIFNINQTYLDHSSDNSNINFYRTINLLSLDEISNINIITIKKCNLEINILNDIKLKEYLNYKNIIFDKNITGYKLNLTYTNKNVIYISDLNLNNDNNTIINEKIINDGRINKNEYLFVNDTNEFIYGYFDTNGLSTLERKDVNTPYYNKTQYYDYFPNRINYINNTYNYSNNSKLEKLDSNIDKECLPLTYENTLLLKPYRNNDNYYYFACTIKFLEESNCKKYISFLLTNISTASNNNFIRFDKFKSLYTFNNKNNDYLLSSNDENTNSMNLLDNLKVYKKEGDTRNIIINIGSNKDNTRGGYTFNIYNKCLNNKLEYILSKYKRKLLNGYDDYHSSKYHLKYVYFEEILGPDHTKDNHIHDISNDLDKKIDNLFSYELLKTDIYDAFDKDNKSTDNTNIYKEIINKVNKVKSYSIYDYEDTINNLIKTIRNTKSNLRTIDYNIEKQKELLSNKASIKECKEWVNQNVFSLASFEYAINELFTDFYYLSNKGAEIDIYDDQSKHVWKYNFSHKYPIININKNFRDCKFLDLDIPDKDSTTIKDESTIISVSKNHKEFYDGYTKWKSQYYLKNDDGIIERSFYDKNEYFLEKIWVSPKTSYEIKPSYYKKNFTDYSNFLEIYSDEDTTIGLRNSSFKFGLDK